MKVSKQAFGAALIFWFGVSSAHALTYDVDILLDDYTYQSIDGAWTYTQQADPVSVVGEIETDGSFGTLNETNILSWSFTISSTRGSQNISSDGLFGSVHTYGTFEVSATEFSAGSGAWGFLEYVNQPSTFVIGRLYGQDGNLHTFGKFQNLSADCLAGICPNDGTTNNGNLALERNAQLIGTASSPLPVPVPASFGLLLSSFAVLGLFGRRRRRQKAA